MITKGEINEENLKFLKDRNYLYFDPLYPWTDQKIRVHALTCVLGLLLVKLLLYNAKKADFDMDLSVMLQEFNDIEEITFIQIIVSRRRSKSFLRCKRGFLSCLD